jgi:hypothetical protein
VHWERPDRFGVFFDITNSGGLPIRIEGMAEDRGGGDSLFPRVRPHSGVEAEADRFPGFSPVTLDSGETASLGLEVIAGAPCRGYGPGSSIDWDSISLRYSYARFFERDVTIPLPVVMSPAC